MRGAVVHRRRRREILVRHGGVRGYEGKEGERTDVHGRTRELREREYQTLTRERENERTGETGEQERTRERENERTRERMNERTRE